MNKILKIGTHNGKFHCDEAMGCMMLLKYTNKFKNSKIIRTRDQSILRNLDIILDVGSEFNVKNNRYDHHQKGFNENFNINFKTKLSSSGLIYKYYGIEIIENIIKEIFKQNKNIEEKYNNIIDKNFINEIYINLYKNFFEEIDAIDNGINNYNCENKFNEGSTSLFSRIDNLNKNYFEDITYDENKNFYKAIDLCEADFKMNFNKNFFSLINKPLLKKYILNRFNISWTGDIIFLEKSFSWKKIIYEAEKELNLEKKIKFVIYQDNDKDMGFKVQAIPKNLNSFESRLTLEKKFHGLSGDNLKEISNINDIVFVHNTGFLGKVWSYENAVKLAELSLNNN